MPNLGETRYYKHRVGGQIEYSAQPWAGNIPEGYTPVAREQFLTETKARKFTHPGTKYPTYYEYLKGEQKGFEEMLAPGYIAPGFERFKPGAPTPSEEYFIPAEKKKAAQEWKEFQEAQAAITKPKTLGMITAPAAKAELPFPQSQAQMAEYQKKAAAGEYIAPTKTGEKWYKSPTPIVPTPSVDPNEQARIDAANKANQAAQTIFDNIPKGDDVDTRDSMKILGDIQAKLAEEEEKIPTPTSLIDLFESKKAELGIEPLETDRADLLTEKDRLQAELFVQAEEAGEELVSTREIGRAKGTIQKRFDREMMLLDVEISAVDRQLSNKYSSLEIVMNLTQQDFENASKYYTDRYNRTISLFNLALGLEEREYTRTEKAETDARANWDIVTNAMKENGISFGDLTDDQKLKLKQFEVQGGLPEGFSEKILASVSPDKTVVSKITSTDKSQISILYDDGTIEVFNTGLAPGVEEEESISARLEDKKGPGGYVDINDYRDERAKSKMGPDEFDKRFASIFLSPGDREKFEIGKEKVGEVEQFITADYIKDKVSLKALEDYAKEEDYKGWTKKTKVENLLKDLIQEVENWRIAGHSDETIWAAILKKIQ